MKNDNLIRFSVVLLQKLGIRRKNYIAQRMPQLACLKKEMGIHRLDEVISGKWFDDILDATDSLCAKSTSSDKLSVF